MELLLEAKKMDAAGRRAAKTAIARLETKGSTNLFGGWDLAAGRVAAAMEADARASHRVLLLTDGLANIGIADAPTLARFTADAQRGGIITSAVGIGDDYDEALLAAMTEAGGGRLHDATDASEIHEVVGPWGATARGRRLEVLVGSLRPEQVKRVVIRVFCHAGVAGQAFEIAAALSAQLPDGSAVIEAEAQVATLTFAEESANSTQAREMERSVAALAAWQGTAMRAAMQLNRSGRFDEAKRYLRGEITLIKRYARGLDGARTLLQELELLYEQIAERMDDRVMKDVYMARVKSGRGERDLRARGRGTVGEMLGRTPRTS